MMVDTKSRSNAMNNEEKTQQFLKKSIKEVIWYLMVFLFLFQ